MAVYETGFDTIEKSDGSPVTIADQRAEAVIEAGLRKLHPSIPLVAEEAVEAGRLPDLDQTYFVVDPLDGTKEFIKRNGEFTVNIALVQNAVPVFGVVYAPALGRLFWGGSVPGDNNRQTGAFAATVSDDQIKEVHPITVRSVPSAGLTVVASRSHLSEETASFVDRFKIAERVSVGSSLKLCLVASGEADLYPRLAPTMFWDIAAGDAVVRAAGGDVVRADTYENVGYSAPGHPVKDDFKSPFFIAVSSKSLLGEAGHQV
ncbi:MAG: 3'(2'),5'-bisphosphate nucleotidase CysQ [Rhodobacteraceae bacterium]|nr:3'(2'),5'-bisphosphate nucleotidase CysQ [Paracoccaceae bacterium]